MNHVCVEGTIYTLSFTPELCQLPCSLSQWSLKSMGHLNIPQNISWIHYTSDVMLS